MYHEKPNVRVPYDQFMRLSKHVCCSILCESKGIASVPSFTLAGKTLVAVSALYGRVENSFIECAEAIPASLYDGKPVPYAEYIHDVQAGRRRRGGGHQGIGVKIKGKAWVLTEQFLIGATAPDARLAVSRNQISSGQFGLYYSKLIRRGDWQRIGNWDVLVDNDNPDKPTYAAFWKNGNLIETLIALNPLTLTSEPAVLTHKPTSSCDQLSLF